MNCGTWKGLKVVTTSQWRAKHKGHRIIEAVKTVKAPGYKVIFDRCEDCSTERHKVEHGRIQNDNR